MGYIKCEAGYVEETGGISTIIVKSTPTALFQSPGRVHLMLSRSWRQASASDCRRHVAHVPLAHSDSWRTH